MTEKRFAVFILTHGRPDKVVTLKALKKAGYTGDLYIIIDNEDKAADQYKKKFGDQVVMFDKKEIAKTFDEADNFNDRRAIVYARNASFKIAKDLGLDYFIQLDDDYRDFSYTFRSDFSYSTERQGIKDINRIFEFMAECVEQTGVDTLAMAQYGEFFGGDAGTVFQRQVLRKAMNSFVCKADRPFQFVGRINEDVNTYSGQGRNGLLMFTTALLKLDQKETQASHGGMTEIYLDSGTYIKSFYSIIFNPSCVKINLMGVRDKRLHHMILWDKAVPKILSEKFKKVA